MNIVAKCDAGHAEMAANYDLGPLLGRGGAMAIGRNAKSNQQSA